MELGLGGNQIRSIQTPIPLQIVHQVGANTETLLEHLSRQFRWWRVTLFRCLCSFRQFGTSIEA